MLMAPEDSYNTSWISQDWLIQNSELKAKEDFCDEEAPNTLKITLAISCQT